MEKATVHNEHELFALIADGDEKAFRQLYVLWKPKLFGYIYKLTQSQNEVIGKYGLRISKERRALPVIVLKARDKSTNVLAASH